jgi:hypothetical protein
MVAFHDELDQKTVFSRKGGVPEPAALPVLLDNDNYRFGSGDKLSTILFRSGPGRTGGNEDIFRVSLAFYIFQEGIYIAAI